MSSRAEKTLRRAKRRQAKAKQLIRREQRQAAPLETAEALQELAAIDAFFSDYRHNKNIEMVPCTLGMIRDLGLLSNRDHALGIATSVQALLSCHPDMVRVWSAKHRDILDRAARICPAGSVDVDGEPIECVADAVQRMIWWMVTGDESLAAEVYSIARDIDNPLQPEVRRIFRWYQTQHRDLADLVRRQALVVRPSRRQAQPAEAASVANLNAAPSELVRQLLGPWLRSPGIISHIVGFVVDTDGGLTVLTLDADVPPLPDGAPVPLRTRVAVESEIRDIQALRDMNEEPY